MGSLDGLIYYNWVSVLRQSNLGIFCLHHYHKNERNALYKAHCLSLSKHTDFTHNMHEKQLLTNRPVFSAGVITILNVTIYSYQNRATLLADCKFKAIFWNLSPWHHQKFKWLCIVLKLKRTNILYVLFYFIKNHPLSRADLLKMLRRICKLFCLRHVFNLQFSLVLELPGVLIRRTSLLYM